jgi:AbiU2
MATVLVRTVRIVSIDLDLALAAYETYLPSGQDANLIKRVNKHDFYPAFNAISDALHRNAIIALCRVWDKDRETASLNTLARLFRKPAVLVAEGHKINHKQLSDWLAEVERVQSADEFDALMTARHRALAHSARPDVPYKGKARAVVYGDERKVLEWTIPIVEQAGKFVGYTYMPFADQRRLRQENSREFWNHAFPED